MKALITGIAGFVGPYLTDVLRQHEIDVYGTYLFPEELEQLDPFPDEVELFQCDLTDTGDVEKVFRNRTYDFIFHLAAQSSVYLSFQKPRLTYEVNVVGTINLSEKIRQIGSIKKMIFTSSADVYGKIDASYLPIRESAPLMALNPYAISKISAEMTCKFYVDAYHIPIVITRAFNHTGPRQTPQFVISDFAKQIAEIEAGKREPVLHVGNLDVKRDFLDVRDVVNAYYQLSQNSKPGEIYNVASGNTHLIREILGQLISFSTKKIEIEIDQAKFRPTELPVLMGDPTKLQDMTGWRPQLSLEQTLADVLNYWRRNVTE